MTDAATDWLAERGFQPEFGARPLRRTIQRELDNQLSRMLLRGEVNPGDKVSVDVVDGHLVITAERNADSTVNLTESDRVHANG